MSIIAFDVHGVLDSSDSFRKLAQSVYESKEDSVYLISGSLFHKEMQELLNKYDIKFDRYFSITQELLDKNPKLITWVDGNPYAQDELWDSMKAIICKKEKVDILFDDSPTYGKYFKDITTTYVEVHNGHWYESSRHKIS